MRFPFTIETSWGGYNVKSPEDLRRLARNEAKLSAGYVASATLDELLPVVLRATKGEVIPA